MQYGLDRTLTQVMLIYFFVVKPNPTGHTNTWKTEFQLLTIDLLE